MCCFKEAVVPSAFIIFVSLLTSTRCDSIINAKEGESVQLDFTYPRSSTKITIQYETRLPFYDSANPDFLEQNPDQSERFKVEATTEEEEDSCSLQLSIDPVKRTDGGTYILLIYDGNYITRVGLHVDFLPGMAHCSFGGSHGYEGDWEKLRCIATVGSMLGHIQCYQGGIRMPDLGAPSENDKTLEQTIMVQQNRHHVYCCSSQLLEPTQICDCHDVVWDPLSKGEVHNPGDPCPPTTHVPTVPLTNSTHHDGTSSTLREMKPTKGEIYREDTKFWIVTIVFVVTFMIAFFAFIIYLARSKHSRCRTWANPAGGKRGSRPKPWENI